jgi:hypothetical protein
MFSIVSSFSSLIYCPSQLQAAKAAQRESEERYALAELRRTVNYLENLDKSVKENEKIVRGASFCSSALSMPAYFFSLFFLSSFLFPMVCLQFKNPIVLVPFI